MHTLPKEIKELIFSFFDIHSLYSAFLVNQEWNQLSSSSSFWKFVVLSAPNSYLPNVRFKGDKENTTNWVEETRKLWSETDPVLSVLKSNLCPATNNKNCLNCSESDTNNTLSKCFAKQKKLATGYQARHKVRGQHLIKLVACGTTGGIGCTALVVQFVHKMFINYYNPTIEDSYQVLVDFDKGNNKKPLYIIDILDTGGQDEFETLRDPQKFKDGDIFVIVYSVISMWTFESAKVIIDKIFTVKERKDVPIVLVGNKTELEDHREVTTAKGVALGKMYKVPFLEVSARDRESVIKLMKTVVRQYNVAYKKSKVMKNTTEV